MATETKAPVVCFANPLSDEILERYAQLIGALPPSPLKSAMEYCFGCVWSWWNLPESKEKVKETWQTTEGQKYDIVPLEKNLIEALDQDTPWDYECQAMNALFDTMPSGKGVEVAATAEHKAYTPVVDEAAFELKTAAKSLVWHAMEITRDRAPITKDKMKD